MKTEVLSFRADIQPLEQKVFKERMKDNGTVSEIRVRFYPGQERELRVRPYVLHTNNRAEDLFTYVGNTEIYLTGDDDYLVFPVSLEMQLDDEFCVWVENANDSYVYTLVVDVVIQYFSEGL